MISAIVGVLSALGEVTRAIRDVAPTKSDAELGALKAYSKDIQLLLKHIDDLTEADIANSQRIARRRYDDWMAAISAHEGSVSNAIAKYKLERRPAKYFGSKRDPDTIAGIVLHGWSKGPPEAGVRYIISPGDGRVVSYHAAVLYDTMIEFVPDDRIAHHCRGWNKRTLGLCLHTTDHPMDSDEREVARAWILDKRRLYGDLWCRTHSSINSNKRDPGLILDAEWMDWFAREGIRVYT